MKKAVELHNPSVIFANVSWTDDKESSEGYDALIEFIDEQESVHGRTCIVADTRNTSRWYRQKKQECRGDLAFRCNDAAILCELQEWAKEKDSGMPRCVEDLEHEHFVGCLSGIAEAHHLDKCVDAAFAGTEEAEAEGVAQAPIDGVFGPEDEDIDADYEEAIDEEDEMLEELPLPGNPQTEKGEKGKVVAATS